MYPQKEERKEEPDNGLLEKEPGYIPRGGYKAKLLSKKEERKEEPDNGLLRKRTRICSHNGCKA